MSVPSSKDLPNGMKYALKILVLSELRRERDLHCVKLTMVIESGD